jgi:hypothetical protein
VPENATVGLVGGFGDDGAIGPQEEPAGFRRKLRAWRVLGYSGPAKTEALEFAASFSPLHDAVRIDVKGLQFTVQACKWGAHDCH